jgi:hypothetical protein
VAVFVADTAEISACWLVAAAAFEPFAERSFSLETTSQSFVYQLPRREQLELAAASS